MIYKDIISFWKNYLGIAEWNIVTEPILKSQVEYDKSIPDEDKYFIGIWRDTTKKIAIIYHDRDMIEEDVLHELIHIKYPNYTEEQVNKYCEELLS